jgi:hypothetical protein
MNSRSASSSRWRNNEMPARGLFRRASMTTIRALFFDYSPMGR